MINSILRAGDTVYHNQYGRGTVISESYQSVGNTTEIVVVTKFSFGTLAVAKKDLTLL